MTSSLVMAILAAGAASGLVLMVRGLRRRRPDLVALLNEVSPTAARRPTLGRASGTDAERTGMAHRLLGKWGVRVLEALGLSERQKLLNQLGILDRSIEQYAYEKMLGAVAGLLLPLLLGFVMNQTGSGLPPGVVLLASLALAIGGFLYPDLVLAEQVAERQAAFRHALAGYLDLVSIILAGGAGVESALIGAANAGDGWVFAELRAALRRGELTGRAPWLMFDETGLRYGVVELQELAASMALAGGQGARVRQTLTAKSESLRSQLGAEIEAKAESATEKMVVPVTIMVLGLMIFIGYGAVVAIGAS